MLKELQKMIKEQKEALEERSMEIETVTTIEENVFWGDLSSTEVINWINYRADMHEGLGTLKGRIEIMELVLRNIERDTIERVRKIF